MRYAETADERDAQQAILEAERRRIDLTPADDLITVELRMTAYP